MKSENIENILNSLQKLYNQVSEELRNLQENEDMNPEEKFDKMCMLLEKIKE